jgi:hypothetical protein
MLREDPTVWLGIYRVLDLNWKNSDNSYMMIRKVDMKFTVISRELIKSLTFRPFDKTDYYAFSGVESPIPLIAENEDEGILMIVDGPIAELYADTGDGGYDCVDVCDDIRLLPMKSERERKIEILEKELAELKAMVA